MDPSGTERRRSPRQPVMQLVKYRCVLGVEDRLEYVGQIVDISEGGAGLKLKRDFPLGAVLEFELPRSGRTVQGRIVWLKHSTEEPGSYRAGVGFVRVNAPAGDEAGRVVPSSGTVPTFDFIDTGPQGRPWKEPIYLKFQCVSEGACHDQDARVGKMLDLRTKGVVFTAVREYPAGQLFAIELQDSEACQGRLIHGRSVWSRAQDTPGQYRIACVFVRVTPPATAPVADRIVASSGTVPSFDFIDVGPQGRAWKAPIYLKYRCVSEGVSHDADALAGRMLDIRTKGVVFTTLKDYPPGLLFEIQLPDSEVCQGRVIHGRSVWSRAQDKPGQHRIACVFVRGK